MRLNRFLPSALVIPVPITRAARRGIAALVVAFGAGALSSAVAASPTGAAGSGSTLYVAAEASNEIVPIDASTGVAGPPIRLGALSPIALAVRPGGKTLYVVADGSDEDGSPGSVIPIATATDKVGKPIAVGTASQGIAITPNGKKAFVLNGIDAATTPETTPATVTPIDLATGKALHPIKVGTLPQSMTMSPNGKLLYVVDSNQSNAGEPSAITPVDTADDTAGREIELSKALVPFPASGIAFTPNSHTAYAITAAGVVPISTATGTAGKVVGLHTADPVAVGVTPTGSSIVEVGTPITALEPKSPYTDNVTFAVVSALTAKVTSVAKLGNEPGANLWQVAVTPDGSIAYLLVGTASPRQSFVVPVDLATGAAGKPIDVGHNAAAVAISPDGATAYVLDEGSYQGVGSPHNIPGSILPIATATGRAGPKIAAGLAPLAFVIVARP
jgi:DNA-binding beta-propeller fold protein YncE